MPIVKLMVADCRGLKVEGVKEICNYLSLASLGPCLDSALVLVPSVQVDGVVAVFLLDDVEEPGHVDEPAVLVLLLVVLPDQVLGEGGAVNVVSAHECHSHHIGAVLKLSAHRYAVSKGRQ